MDGCVGAGGAAGAAKCSQIYAKRQHLCINIHKTHRNPAPVVESYFPPRSSTQKLSKNTGLATSELSPGVESNFPPQAEFHSPEVHFR